jgi:TonB family protein
MRVALLPASVVLALSVVLSASSLFAQGDETAAGTRKVTNRVVPAYPSIARTMNLTGTVRLEALVLPNGNVKSVQVKGGNPLLVQSAENAIHSWKWEKANHESTELVEFNFSPK